jgi:signal transduction histidine kinase
MAQHTSSRITQSHPYGLGARGDARKTFAMSFAPMRLAHRMACMYPLRLGFEGYSLIGMTLLIMALAMLFLILRQPAKSGGGRLVGVFFGAIALSGAATVLANGIVFWGSVFSPWQDFWILAGGVALVRYAYVHPRCDRPREAVGAVLVAGVLAFVAFVFCVVFSYRFVSRWSPDLAVPWFYYLLLPLGTTFSIAVFLRRSVHLSRCGNAAGDCEAMRGEVPVLQCLGKPRSNDARLMRSLALALCVALLPGVSMFLKMPGTVAFMVQHVGSLVAVAGIALVYLNHVQELSSFVTKLAGVALLTVTLLIGGMGNYFYGQLARAYERDCLSLVAQARALLTSGQPLSVPLPVGYVVAWDASRTQHEDAYRVLFTPAGQTGFDLDRLVAENRQGHLASWSRPATQVRAASGGEAWYAVPRWRTYPVGSSVPEYTGFGFSAGGTTYEIGLLEAHREEYLNGVTTSWLATLGMGALLVLLVFPLFLRATLVRPLADLIAGVKRVEAGALDTTVTVRYADEIGELTRSFNALTRTMKESYEELENRVAARTRELSAFFDLAMLSDIGDELSRKLRPALERIAEAGGCSALCLHLAGAEEQELQLVSHVALPAPALAKLQSVSLTAVCATRMRESDQPWVTSDPAAAADLPPAFRIPGFRHYLGTSLGRGGSVQGWLSCYRSDGAAFGVSETSLLVALARQIGVIVENHRMQQVTGQLAAFEERQRLARDLHDSVTQLMYGLTLFSRAGKDAMADGDLPRAASNLDRVGDTAQLALREMRSLLFELQPPSLEQDGLAHALQERLDIVERRVGIRVQDRIDDSLAIPYSAARELYLVAMECLNNSLKHAHADEIRVSLARTNGALQMSIADNGCGFDPARVSGGLGLSSMKHRVDQLGGEFSLDAAIGGGARITVTVPVVAGEAARG